MRRKNKVPIIVHSKSQEDILDSAGGGLVGLHEAHFDHRVRATSFSADWTEYAAVSVDDILVADPGV